MQAYYPQWLQDFNRLLPVRSQFIFSGYIRDRFLQQTEQVVKLSRLMDCLWASLQEMGFVFMLIYDPIDGIRVFPDNPENQKRAKDIFEIELTDGAMPIALNRLLSKIRLAVQQSKLRVAFVIDFASRIAMAPQSLSEDEKRFFVGCEKLALNTLAVMLPDQPKVGALFNPVIWLVNRAQDMPSWYALDCEKVHTVEIGRPTAVERADAARVLVARFSGAEEANNEQKEKAIKCFTDATDDLSLQALQDISQLAKYHSIPISEIDDAIRAFKVGGESSPWKSTQTRHKIIDAPSLLEKRVKGQHQAIVKTVDILTRSVMGLTGAQLRSSGMRPRGVLFFAGPTGVGKTELAKSLTELLFGDESHYIRFDMSEFSEEHASARLLGAPPGYVGYEAGGELTNRIRQKPFSVILFDEIEKAHPRLLDKFLQILEDGRLTDGRGETVYFSESVIIFTSNLGSYVTGDDGQRVQNVKIGDPYETVEERVRGAISEYFKFHLSRPEILNRIGDNIVVFSFIQPDVALNIFNAMLDNVINRVKEEHQVILKITEPVRQQLETWCTEDLSNGGRGIGNRLETTFVNPLARSLFKLDLTGQGTLVVQEVTCDAQIYSVHLNDTAYQ